MKKTKTEKNGIQVEIIELDETEVYTAKDVMKKNSDAYWQRKYDRSFAKIGDDYWDKKLEKEKAAKEKSTKNPFEKQHAEYMDVTKDTVRNWIKKTDIPAHKIGKLWKFKKSELDAWLKSGRSAI